MNRTSNTRRALSTTRKKKTEIVLRAIGMKSTRIGCVYCVHVCFGNVFGCSQSDRNKNHLPNGTKKPCKNQTTTDESNKKKKHWNGIAVSSKFRKSYNKQRRNSKRTERARHKRMWRHDCMRHQTVYTIFDRRNSIYKESKTQFHSQLKQSTGESETSQREIVSATRTMTCRSAWNGITDLTKRNYRAANLSKQKQKFSESEDTPTNLFGTEIRSSFQSNRLTKCDRDTERFHEFRMNSFEFADRTFSVHIRRI